MARPKPARLKPPDTTTAVANREIRFMLVPSFVRRHPAGVASAVKYRPVGSLPIPTLRPMPWRILGSRALVCIEVVIGA
jgi:hypothetical protein